MKTRLAAGTGISLGAIIGVPAAAQADDFQVTNLNNSGAGSLRQAILDANDNSGADRVLFKSKLSGTIELAAGDGLEIEDDVEIRGPGARKLAVTKASSTPDSGSILVPANNFAGTVDVTISDLELTGNTSTYNGGAIAAYANSGPLALTLSRVTISGNTATGDSGIGDGDGGAISAFSAGGGGVVTIDRSTISGNTTEDDGGGIYTYGGFDLSITNSTLSGNHADDNGGGASPRYADQTTIVNSTVSRNSADSYGGGIQSSQQSVLVRSSTVADNTANYGGGIATYQSSVEFHGTIVADNVADGIGPNLLDIGGSTFEGAFSLIEDPDPETVSGSTNLLGVDPKLKPLANNGGPTDTHAFRKSPAKNKVPKSESEKKDQRGAKRKGKGDIGAYELVKCEGVIVNRVGTGKKDKLKGTKRKDGILGLGGNDKLSGKKGKDGLCGGRGKDKLIGGPGKDRFNGGPGKDKEIQ